MTVLFADDKGLEGEVDGHFGRKKMRNLRREAPGHRADVGRPREDAEFDRAHRGPEWSRGGEGGYVLSRAGGWGGGWGYDFVENERPPPPRLGFVLNKPFCFVSMLWFAFLFWLSSAVAVLFFGVLVDRRRCNDSAGSPIGSTP